MTTNFDFSNAPDFAKKDKVSTLIWDGAPLHYRFNGRDGCFYVGEFPIAKLWMQVLDWRWIEEARFGGSKQYWIDVLFADLDAVVSIVSLKKSGAEAMGAFLKKLGSPIDFDIEPHSISIELSASIVESQAHDYYLPRHFDWQWLDSRRFADACDWLEFGKPKNPWILTGEVDCNA
jgi:hypothetical protein